MGSSAAAAVKTFLRRYGYCCCRRCYDALASPISISHALRLTSSRADVAVWPLAAQLKILSSLFTGNRAIGSYGVYGISDREEPIAPIEQ